MDNKMKDSKVQAFMEILDSAASATARMLNDLSAVERDPQAKWVCFDRVRRLNALEERMLAYFEDVASLAHARACQGAHSFEANLTSPRNAALTLRRAVAVLQLQRLTIACDLVGIDEEEE